MILIGSRALALRNKDLLGRAPLDFDFVATKAEFDNWLEKNRGLVNPTEVYFLSEYNKWIVKGSSILEFEITTPGHSSELLADLVYNDPESIETPFGHLPTLDLLFTIKDSHKYKKFESPRGCANFYKTALDWHSMRDAGAKVRPEYESFLKLREKETYTHKLPKLNVSKQDFFDSDKNGVVQIYIHDDIHRAVAINDKPAYEYYLKDGSEVLTSKKKFFECSEHIQLCGVIEEALVLALERSCLPHPGVWTPEYAFHFALAKVSSTICGGYFRAHAFNNLFKALNSYPKDYLDKFQKAVKDGKVRPFNSQMKTGT